MKAIFPILLCLTSIHPATGQEIENEDTLARKVRNAIREFNREDIVAQDDLGIPPAAHQADGPDEEPAVAIPVPEQDTDPDDIPPGTEPTLVTGKPPADEPAEHAVEPQEEDHEEEPAAPAEKDGLGIRVESIRDGKGGGIQGEIKLKAGFPAKALSTAPDGWVLEKSSHAPAFIEKVTLRPGKSISLSISPHVLVPAADGENTFGVVEPGFDASEGYRQSNTVSAILGNSVVQLDRDSLLLGNAISDLHQLLASLPKPETEPEATPKP